MDLLNKQSTEDGIPVLESIQQEYKKVFEQMVNHAESLYHTKQQALQFIQYEVLPFLESKIGILGTVSAEIKSIKAFLQKYNQEQQHIQNKITQAQATALSSATTVGAGALAGVGVATFGPTATMAIATTFGTASTGTTSATSSRSVATSTALDWLAGGCIVVGATLLTVTGPVGWVIGGTALLAGSLMYNSGNQGYTENTNKVHHEYQKLIEQTKAQMAVIIRLEKAINHLIELLQQIMKQDSYKPQAEGTTNSLRRTVSFYNISETTEKQQISTINNLSSTLLAIIDERVDASKNQDYPYPALQRYEQVIQQ